MRSAASATSRGRAASVIAAERSTERRRLPSVRDEPPPAGGTGPGAASDFEGCAALPAADAELSACEPADSSLATLLAAPDDPPDDALSPPPPPFEPASTTTTTSAHRPATAVPGTSIRHRPQAAAQTGERPPPGEAGGGAGVEARA